MNQMASKKTGWHKPTDKERLDAANERYNLPKKKGERLDWWDKLKIAVYEGEELKDADFTVIEPAKLPAPKMQQHERDEHRMDQETGHDRRDVEPDDGMQ